MTGLIPDKAFSRRTFVKGGGALIVGFSTFGVLEGKAQAATGNTPFSQRTPADYLPNLQSVDSWIAIRPVIMHLLSRRLRVPHGHAQPSSASASSERPSRRRRHWRLPPVPRRSAAPRSR